MLPVATASAITSTTTGQPYRRPNLVSVGTIVWLSSELMFFAALFAMYFTIRSVSVGQGIDWAPAYIPAGASAEGLAHLNIPFATVNTTILVLSSVTCQLGVWAAEKGQVSKLRFWYLVSFLMGSVFIAGQLYEYMELASMGATLSANPYTSVFYLTTGFHGLHVTGGLIAFLFVLGRTYAAKRFTHEQATSAIVVSYYWHFVDVVWIGLFATIYIIQ
ncbi:heme-copper oxidase subunit III [Nonomuraea sp. NPDC050478]|jgi:cytochrome c oxidase subunit 3|uniref:aa3-type cytochrome oxidase subunit III n=1 Tax=unclassified Nonomuraea TaxID=2593643 RepID=UPI0011CE3B53|nr:heme-copper oxidase subunit III [Nonomuraea sp. C10]TXK42010.1 heme-copper oxidase subunit III [Nonomuraea sp. C10]